MHQKTLLFGPAQRLIVNINPLNTMPNAGEKLVRKDKEKRGDISHHAHVSIRKHFKRAGLEDLESSTYALKALHNKAIMTLL